MRTADKLTMALVACAPPRWYRLLEVKCGPPPRASRPPGSLSLSVSRCQAQWQDTLQQEIEMAP